ncbi:MAG: hypothetical protein JXR95_15870 [Deltaproteobacteria bacterium]|nr:hypothetical protein [Deltaproteobacteria bacterium]
MGIPPQEEGTVIYPVRNGNGHNYTIGKGYIISYIDDDGTFKCKDPETGTEGNWIKWEDVSLTPPLGWLWLKEQLTDEVVSLLSLFEGIENLIIREDVKDQLITDIPDLRVKLLGLAKAREEKVFLPPEKKNNLSILSFPKNSNVDDFQTESFDPEEYEALMTEIEKENKKKKKKPTRSRKKPTPDDDDK